MDSGNTKLRYRKPIDVGDVELGDSEGMDPGADARDRAMIGRDPGLSSRDIGVSNAINRGMCGVKAGVSSTEGEGGPGAIG
jgi:hypothetical protein